MVESAAIRDISEASVYQGSFLSVSKPSAALRCLLEFPPPRIHSAQVVHQGGVLCILRHPRSQCVPDSLVCCSGELIDCSLVVRVRSREGRRNRAPPPRPRYKDGKKINPAVAAAEDAKAANARGGAPPAA